jgi:hypothetical protein
MTRLRFPAVVVGALLPLGCGHPARDRPSPATTTAAEHAPGPALCTRVRARVVGRVTAGAAIELSGLVLSRSKPRVLWTHNDSGDRARVLAIAPNGRLLADVAVAGAENVDWEDIAIGPAAEGGDALYVGDIGDNSATRPEVVVYRVPEPRIAGGVPSATAPAQRLTLRYPDGAHDAEALLVDPFTGAVVIVTKDLGGLARVYVADHPSPDTTATLRRAGSVSLGPGEAITAGDVSADGRTVVLRTYDRAFVWRRRRHEPLASAVQRRPCAARANLLVEGQGEALALTRSGRAFFTLPEGARPALRRYAGG